MSAEVLRYAAFTDQGRGGNPAGVVLDAGALADAEMLAIAHAIGYSETAFVTGPATPGPSVPRTSAPDPAATIRFFSPVAEVAFCGHATVATAVALAERNGPGRIRFGTAAGPVTVTTQQRDGGLAATLTSPPTRTRPVPEPILASALRALRWTTGDLDPRYPARVAFAGNDHLMIAARSRETLAGLDYDYPALATLMTDQRWTTVHLFWAQDETTHWVRNAFPPGGVTEDPATGAAAAAFGGYLRDFRLVPPWADLVLHQGQDMGCPSLLLVGVRPGTRSVQVTGWASPLVLAHDEISARTW